MAGTYKTVLAIDTAITSINSPNYFWFTAPTQRPPPQPPSTTLSIVYGNSANLDTTTSVWTCPATGLLQFTFSIFCESYSGYPEWCFFHNGTVLNVVQVPSNSSQGLTSVGPFVTPAKAGDTFQWTFNFFSDSSPPVLVSGPGNFWQGFMIAWVYCGIRGHC